VILEKGNNIYVNSEEKDKEWFKRFLTMDKNLKKYWYQYLGEETIDGKSYLSFENPFTSMKNASYWVATFIPEGYDDQGCVNMIAHTNKLVIKDANGKVTELFDDRFDYGWNWKFDVDTLSSTKFVYKKLYPSGGVSEMKSDAHNAFSAFFDDLLEFVKTNKNEIYESFRIYLGVDNTTGQYNVFFLNSHEYVEKDDAEAYRRSLDGITCLHTRFRFIQLDDLLQ